jgi:phosphohistidine phosphatase SixA
VPTLLLVRHADAGDRGVGAADVLRPLSVRGQHQALALVELLVPLVADVADPARPGGAREDPPPAAAVPRTTVTVRSSPAVRCLDTVAPLAAALGTHVERDVELFEGTDVSRLLDRVVTLTASEVWASHGDVIPELLRLVALRGVDLGPDPRCRKASTWLLEVHDGAVTTARGLAPPDVPRGD